MLDFKRRNTTKAWLLKKKITFKMNIKKRHRFKVPFSLLKVNYKHFFKKKMRTKDGDMVQQIKVLAALPKDPG